MRINQLLIDAAQLIGQASSSARLDAELLLAHALGVGRVQLIAALQDQVAAAEEELFRKLLHRRVAGEPIAYLIGEREFYGRKFVVTSDVLIPRPETELLIARLRSLRLLDHSRVLDMGTGSGCIGVTAACEVGCHVVCVDISAAALAVAETNALAHGVSDRMEFICSDLFAALEPQRFDVIVSNPPYLSEQELNQRKPLSFEPAVAFVAKDDGLALVRAIFKATPQWLHPGGTFLCEFGYRHEAVLGELLANLVLQHGGSGEVFKDLSGIGRVAEWRRGLI